MKNFFNILNESKTERGRGSKEGRSAINTSKKKSHTQASKSRVRIFK